MHLLPLVLLVTFSSVFATPAPSSSSYRAPPQKTHDSKGGAFVAGWYPAWQGNDWPPSYIPWGKYSAVYFAFAVTTPNVHTISLDDKSLSVVPDFVSLAKHNNVKAIVSLGGWTGSRFFSPAVASAENRTAFVKTVVDFASKYKFDGVEFDWEFPGRAGLECNVVSANDSANFLAFLQALRNDPVGKNLIITGAVSTNAFIGSDGNPLSDLSAFAQEFDFVAIMGYDFSGPWSKTAGPNAPLDDSCAPPPRQRGSLTGALKAWTSAKFPTNKLVLGVPAYARGFSVEPSAALDASGQLNLYPIFTGTPNGDKWGEVPGADRCGTKIKSPGGVLDFWGLVDTGFLTTDGTPVVGIHYRFDNCTQTPYLYNKTSQVYISYDNAESIAAKGQFAKSNGLKGVSLWDVSGDYKDILIDSVNKAVKP